MAKKRLTIKNQLKKKARKLKARKKKLKESSKKLKARKKKLKESSKKLKARKNLAKMIPKIFEDRKNLAKIVLKNLPGCKLPLDTPNVQELFDQLRRELLGSKEGMRLECSNCGNNTFVKKGSSVFCPKCGSMPYEEKDNLSKKKFEKLTIPYLTPKEKRKRGAKRAAVKRKENYEKMTPEQKIELHLKLSASSKNSWKKSTLLQKKMTAKTRNKYGIKK